MDRAVKWIQERGKGSLGREGSPIGEMEDVNMEAAAGVGKAGRPGRLWRVH